MRQALKKTKTGRTSVIDSILAELYKADSDVTVKELTRLFNKIRWHEEKVPDQWKKGLDNTRQKKRRFERVQELAWRDIVICG